MKIGHLLVPALLAAAVPSLARAAEWPGWRGPGRDGHAADRSLEVAWDETGPPVLWRRPAGEGFSSVTAVAGRLYTAWRDGDSEAVVALDAASGAELWRTPVGPVYENERGGGPRSTPTFDGDRLLVVSGGGRLVALAVADGRLLWQRDLVKELGAEVPIWGFAASPLVEGNRVIVPVGGEGQAVAAFDRDDGRLLWSAHSDAIGYSSPVAMDLAGTRQVVTLTGQSISGVGLDGALLWSWPWPVVNNINIATPVALPGDRIFVSTSYDVGSAVLGIARTAEGFQVAEVWRDRVMKNHFQDSILRDGYLYGFDNTILKCIEAASGSEAWRQRGFGKGQLVLAGDRLVVLGERGRIAVVEASPEAYRELASAPLPSRRYWTPPTLVDGRLFVRTEEEILALDLSARRLAGEGGPTPGDTAPAGAAIPPVADAGELIRRNLAGRGAEQAWQLAGTVRLTGRFNRNGRESRLTVWRQGAQRVRLEIAFGGRTEIFVHDRGRGWFQPLGEEGSTVEGERLARLLAMAEAFFPPRDPWRRLDTVDYLGLTAGTGEPLHRLRVVRAGAAQEWRLSAADFDLAETSQGTEEQVFDTFHGDFREVGGLRLPHYAEISFGTGLYSLTVDEVELGVEQVGEALFAIPVEEPAGGGR